MSFTNAFLLILAIGCFSTAFLQRRSQSFGLPICVYSSLSGGGNRYFTSRLAFFLLLLIMGLLVIRTWCMQRIQTLTYLKVPIKPMRMLFQVFRMHDFMHFLPGIKVLTLLSKIRIYSRFCLVFVHVFSNIKIKLLHLVGS